MHKTSTGIEITTKQVRSALVQRKSDVCRLKKITETSIPAGIVNPSFKKRNIKNENEFIKFIKQACKKSVTKNVHVAIPDSSSKILIKQFKELPKDQKEISEMVMWSISNSLDLSLDEVRVSSTHMGTDSAGNHIFLIALSMEEVITQYEDILAKAGISPKIISPAGINQFNFYSGKIPDHHNVAYLALFDDFINIFVFSMGIPLLYKMVKKDLFNTTGDSAINDIDLLIQYFKSEKPDLLIDHFYIASHVKSKILIAQILQNLIYNNVSETSVGLETNESQDKVLAGFTVFTEKEFIEMDKNIETEEYIQQLHYYSTVIGTAIGS